ncbi:hypothetical protein HK414_11795 [Ramlibacter terrae]|uniref:Uncharacterized protein n=1 Tax=Ramlibacter terrae TaxID=2732511 RepID=A0ABX6P2H4_9BURK|nr:hypothetical protein HK414_11795 [Ramlibacter terrae]
MQELHAGAQASQTYTAAPEELGLSWEWDPSTYGPGREGLRAYLEKEQPHLLRAYEADFLLEAVESTRRRLERTR